jgi:FkbM family methyltransferase
MEIFEKYRNIINESQKPIVFEFGMCDGYHSNLLLRALSENGKGFIYNGCEPVKELFDGINLIYDRNIGMAQKHNIAIGNKDEVIELYKSGGERIENGVVMDRYYGSSSIRKPKLVTEAWKSMTFNVETAVCLKFDTLVNRLGLQNEVIDFIWADIQGAEVDMINGGVETFKNVKYLYTEYNNSELYEGEIGLQGICSLLPDFQIVYDYGGDVLLKNNNI